MKSPWKLTLAFGSTLFAVGTGAQAQTATALPAAQPLSAAVRQAPLYDPQQLPAYKGQLRQFTLTPRGDIDGLILGDGTEVKVPPCLSTELAYSIKPGDSVTVHGLRAAALPLMQAASITDDVNGRTVIDNGQPVPKRGRSAPPPPVAFGPAGVVSQVVPVAPPPGLVETQGRVRMTLHGPQGEVNGALLEDGTVLRLPPPEADRFASLLQPRRTVVAEGTGFSNAIGKVVEVWQIGATRDQLSQVQMPPGQGGDKGRRVPPAFTGFAPPPPAPGVPPTQQP
jgi:hypothetical protein